jgi:hypothetical protein
MKEQQHELTREVTAVLDQGIRQLDAETLSRLYAGRRKAVAGLHAQHAGHGLLALRRHPLLLALPLGAVLLVVAWLVWHGPSAQAPPAPDNSELDVQLLTGELPPQVFADWGLVTRENIDDVCLHDS